MLCVFCLNNSLNSINIIGVFKTFYQEIQKAYQAHLSKTKHNSNNYMTRLIYDVVTVLTLRVTDTVCSHYTHKYSYQCPYQDFLYNNLIFIPYVASEYLTDVHIMDKS